VGIVTATATVIAKEPVRRATSDDPNKRRRSEPTMVAGRVGVAMRAWTRRRRVGRETQSGKKNDGIATEIDTGIEGATNESAAADATAIARKKTGSGRSVERGAASLAGTGNGRATRPEGRRGRGRSRARTRSAMNETASALRPLSRKRQVSANGDESTTRRLARYVIH
jgi:hypothetical protein